MDALTFPNAPDLPDWYQGAPRDRHQSATAALKAACLLIDKHGRTAPDDLKSLAAITIADRGMPDCGYRFVSDAIRDAALEKPTRTQLDCLERRDVLALAGLVARRPFRWMAA